MKLVKSWKERNKHLRIVDSSPGGWDTVSNYITNPIANDSEDDSKINKAENKAIKKRKFSKPIKGKDKSNFSATASNAVLVVFLQTYQVLTVF